MAWEKCEWACGHEGSMQLYGKHSARKAKLTQQAGRVCLACWLIEQWVREKDPRAAREDRFELAKAVAEGKGIRIEGEERITRDEPLIDETEAANKAMLDTLMRCRTWFEKHSPTAPTIIESRDGEHPMLTAIKATILQAREAGIVTMDG